MCAIFRWTIVFLKQLDITRSELKTKANFVFRLVNNGSAVV